MVVTLQDIVREVSKATKLALPDTKVVVRKILASLKQGLMAGHRIEIRDFGVFRTKTVTGKKARDLSRNLTIFLPSYRKVSFKPGKNLRHTFWSVPEAAPSSKTEATAKLKGQLEMFAEASKP